MMSSGITSGFVSLSDNLLARIVDRVNSPTICMKIEFLNVNKQTKSPIVGDQFFDLIQDRLYNGRPAWSNGGDTFLSYVPPPDDDDSSPGSWLVGNEPGVDSGFAYLKPKHDVFVPVGVEVRGEEKWHWLEHTGWEKAQDVRLVCKDEVFMGSNHFFHVEYFDHGHAMTTMLSPPPMNAAAAADTVKIHPQLKGKRFPSLSSASLWNADKEEWIPIMTSSTSSGSPKAIAADGNNKFNVLCHFGAPTMITDSLGASTVGHLISQEHGENQSWTLTFRRIVKERLKWDTNDLMKAGAIKPTTDDNSGPPAVDLESPAPEEILLNLDSQGQARGGKKGNKRAKVTLRPLTDEELQKYHMEMLEPTQRVQKGHFVWVWYSTPVSYSTLDSDNAISKGRSIGANDGNTATESHVGVDGSVVSSSEVLVDTNDGTSLQRYRQQQQQQQQPNRNQQSNSVVETSVEMLLECVARYDNKIIFTYHYADRRDVMRQSMLSKDTQYFVATIQNDHTVTFQDFQGKIMNIDGAFFIGSDLLGFIRRYLVYKDGTLADLPSCYLYHAGVSLPVSLVYAAEIVCVLMGAKAITMIQYSTPTDHQWKFPLVAALARAVAQSNLLLDNNTTTTDATHRRFDVEIDTFTYGKDQSLIMYRTNRRYLVDSLMPQGKKAQALHPLPYPDDKDPYPDWQEQIYNAWWNGYILGYPERFIDSYCETFHNGLTVEERMVQARRGKTAVKQYLAKANAQGKGVGSAHQAIGMGVEPSISEEMWSFLATLMRS